MSRAARQLLACLEESVRRSLRPHPVTAGDRASATGSDRQRPTTAVSGTAAPPWATCPRPACAGTRLPGTGTADRTMAISTRMVPLGPRPGTAVTDDLPAGGLQGGVRCGRRSVLGREPSTSPAAPRKVAASTGPTPNSPSRLVLDWTTTALMRASTVAIRCSSWRASATSSVASCQRVTAGAPLVPATFPPVTDPADTGVYPAAVGANMVTVDHDHLVLSWRGEAGFL